MSVLVFQHDPREDAALLGHALSRHGHRLRVLRLDLGQPLPADLDDVDGVVSMGGPMNVDESAKHAWMPGEMAMLRAAHEARKPVVGVCLGAQLIAAALGGKVAAMAKPEVGWHALTLSPAGATDPLLAGQPLSVVQFHLHGQQVTELPAGAANLASTPACRNQAFRVGFRTYAFQYHVECDEAHIQRFAQDELVQRSPGGVQAVLDATPAHFLAYRRLGDRLCESLATLLFDPARG